MGGKHKADWFLTERYPQKMADSAGSDFVVGSSKGTFGGTFEGKDEGISRSCLALALRIFQI